jgi:hypothetical protein
MFMGLILVSIDLLTFVAFEETLHGSVVVAVSFAAHALQIVAPNKPIAVRKTSELGASIAVQD